MAAADIQPRWTSLPHLGFMLITNTIPILLIKQVFTKENAEY
jgi:hypothetical protein